MKKVLSLLAIVFLLTACSGKPSDTQVQDALENEMSKIGIDTFYSINDFNKTNGFEKDDRTYVADVSYVVAMKGKISDASNAKPEFMSDGKVDAMLVVNKAAQFFRHLVIAKGMRVTEKITLIKSDNGWVVNDRSEDKKFEFQDGSGQWRPTD